MADGDSISLDTGQIREWRSIVTLLVFVLTNVFVLAPVHVPVYVPRRLWTALLDGLARWRIIAPPDPSTSSQDGGGGGGGDGQRKRRFVRFRFPLNFVTAPVLADLLLLALRAIGRAEVYGGTVGANNIAPIDIMVFFLTLAYVALSIDASGLLRYLAGRVLRWGGTAGHRLFFCLYVFFFALGSVVGNDPIVLSGTAFLAYLTRAARNIAHPPRAWIHTQFAVANTASALLVSSNPTNLVLAGAFRIRFITYTANVAVPVVATAVVLFPVLLEAGRGDSHHRLPLDDILYPTLDKASAVVGACIMAAALITLLVLNAANQTKDAKPVYWVTLPAAFVMVCWDATFGWLRRVGACARTTERTVDRPVARNEAVATPTTTTPSTTTASDVENQATQTDAARVRLSSPPTPPRTLVAVAAAAVAWLQTTFPTVSTIARHLPLALVPFAFAMFVLVQALVTKGWVPVFAYGWDHWVHATGTVGAVGGMGLVSVLLCNCAGTNIGATILLSRVVQTWLAIHAARGTAVTERTFWATVYSLALGVNYGAYSTAVSSSLAGLLWRNILAGKHIHVRARDFARTNAPIVAVAMAVGCSTLIAEVYIVRGTTAYVP
ncbi:Arsenical pump membrane protein, ArsB [Niveomyces insectorum RCEF 264]|uniref:Arsenical pump membrane protein, ArsB n=1 Tax=Niveomyces insectorum RCEF 264 TaxID=1081102 RepID=A0A162MPX2_9HYPO|nr:Arsenical pump membrane protein, ArsB [Niveomyces insectorum RCEF 264]